MKIIKIKLNSNGYTKTYENGVNASIVGSYENDDEVTEFVDGGGIVEPEFTAEQIEAARISSITSKANELIEAKYSPLKQRKLSSIAIGILYQKITVTLTAEELTALDIELQKCIDADIWIASNRDIENAAIAAGKPLKDIAWNM